MLSQEHAKLSHNAKAKDLRSFCSRSAAGLHARRRVMRPFDRRFIIMYLVTDAI